LFSVPEDADSGARVGAGPSYYEYELQACDSWLR
jgi:hypothetical protein